MGTTLHAVPKRDDFFDRLEAVRTRKMREFHAKRREELAKARRKPNYLRILLNWFS